MRYTWTEGGDLVLLHENGFPGPPMAFEYTGEARDKAIELFDIAVPARFREEAV